MLRKILVFAALVTASVVGDLTAPLVACDGKPCGKACLQANEDDLCLLDELIERQKTTNDAETDTLEQILALQLRLRSATPHVKSEDLALLEKLIVLQKRSLLTVDKAARAVEITILERLVSLKLRAQGCLSRSRAGTPPCPPKCAITGGGKVVMTAPADDVTFVSTAVKPSCCSKKTAACCEAGCVDACCVREKTVVQQFIVQDEKPVTHRAGGFSVATCQGPINMGPIEVQGGGRESNLYAGTLFNNVVSTQEREFSVAVNAQRNCSIQTTVPYCYGRRSCCGVIPRSCTYCTGRGCSYCTGAVRFCTYCRGVGCTRCRGVHFHGTSIQRTSGGCSHGSSSGCSTGVPGQYLCGCAGHLANCRARGLDPRTTPCTCVNCPNASNMVYLDAT